MKKAILATMIALMATISFAQVDKEMTDKLKKEFPNLKVKQAIYLPEVNLYEILKEGTDMTLSYTNKSIDFILLNGEILDPKKFTNVSKERVVASNQRFYKSLPFEKSIEVKYGTGARKIAIFTDPDCPYCKKLDNEIHTKLKNENITINYFMNPLRLQGHEQSPLKAAKIWCSKNKAKSWVDFMTTGVLPTNDGTCKNPVAETKALSESMGFNATPTIVFDNGFYWRGDIEVSKIMELLKQREVK